MRSLSHSSISILFGALAVFCGSLSQSQPLFVSAFTFSKVVSKQAERTMRHNTLGMVTTTTRSTNGFAEEDAAFILTKAREFALRDDCGSDFGGDNEYDKHYHSLSDEKAESEEAKFWLGEILLLQSGCVAGTLAGKDLCENQDQAAEIVSHLRRKVEIHENRVASRTKGSDSIVPTIATELIVGALLVIMFMLWTTLDLPQRYHGIPKIANYQEYLGVLKEKGYLLSLFQGGNSNI